MTLIGNARCSTTTQNTEAQLDLLGRSMEDCVSRVAELLDEGRGRAMDEGVKFGRKRSWTPEQAGATSFRLCKRLLRVRSITPRRLDVWFHKLLGPNFLLW